MKKILFLFLLLLTTSVSATASDTELKQKADKFYEQEKFEQAANAYSRLLEHGQSAQISYNLGNCYYRMDQIAKAVLWYERAYILSPGDADIRFNLDMARSKTIDKVVPEHKMFFVEWYYTLLNLLSVNVWAWLSIVLFAVSLVSLVVFFISQQVVLRKCGFFLCLLTFIFCLFANVCTWTQQNRLKNRTGAIVMSPSVVVKSTPTSSGNDLFVLHEGTRVEIMDDSIDGWIEVQLADGKIGWIVRPSIEII